MILSIDPALRETGIARFYDDRTRLETFCFKGGPLDYPGAVRDWLSCRFVSPEFLIIEWPPQKFRGRNPQTRLLAFCSGCWASTIRAERIMIFEPLEWAEALWGHRKPSASMIWQEAEQFLGRAPEDAHQADAICIGLAGIKRMGGG